MLSHFKQIRHLHRNASIQMPNGIFRQLSRNFKDKNGDRTSQQISFAYSYLVAIAFLYKYTNFVDMSSGTYIQNSDLKELLGYSKTTKSINQVIAKGGILEQMQLVQTTRDYPVRFELEDKKEKSYRIREFTYLSELHSEDVFLEQIKGIVKNRNYEIREPLFLTGIGDNEGTLMDYSNTHKITIKEFVTFIGDDGLDNIEFLLYAYLKSKCQNEKGRNKSLSLDVIVRDTGMDAGTFYRKLTTLKERKYIDVIHGKWKMKNPDKFVRMIANRYFWKGVS